MKPVTKLINAAARTQLILDDGSIATPISGINIFANRPSGSSDISDGILLSSDNASFDEFSIEIPNEPPVTAQGIIDAIIAAARADGIAATHPGIPGSSIPAQLIIIDSNNIEIIRIDIIINPEINSQHDDNANINANGTTRQLTSAEWAIGAGK